MGFCHGFATVGAIWPDLGSRDGSQIQEVV